MRCAIVIEREFAITKAPTKSAIPPNASRKSCRKWRKLSVLEASFDACAVPLLTWVLGGRTPWIWAMRVCCGTPGFDATRI
jgi:hypothetical protein